MYTSTRRQSRWPLLLFWGGAVLCGGVTPARAEIDIEVFGGAHFYSTDGRLGRKLGLSDETTALQHSGIFGLRVGYLPIPRLGIEAEIGASPTRMRGQDGQYAMLPLRLHLLVNLMTGRFRPFVLAGGGGHLGSPIGPGLLQTDAVGAIHAGAGAKFDIRPNWGLRLDGRVIFPEGVDHKLAIAPEGEVLLGVYARFGGTAPAPPQVVDKDGDGVADAEDACPAESGLAVNSGCPDRDGDGDGIVDRLDRCPMERGVEENGGCADKDADGDGVVDRLDRCPDKAGVQDNAGCPPRDGDADGIPDKDDRCPTEEGVPANNGCPDKDADNDGVVDRLDRCPDQAETKNNFQDDDGCPDEVPQAVKKFTGAIKGINFEAGKAVILAGSFKVLDQAVAVLKDNPSVKLEIAGHTDTTGDAQKNRDLSQQRAEAVRKYLVDKGIAPERLKAAGYGPDKPVGDNKTAAGRAQNRRVEFTLING